MTWICNESDKFKFRVFTVNKRKTGVNPGRVSVLEESPDLHADSRGVFKGTCEGCGKLFMNLSGLGGHKLQ